MSNLNRPELAPTLPADFSVRNHARQAWDRFSELPLIQKTGLALALGGTVVGLGLATARADGAVKNCHGLSTPVAQLPPLNRGDTGSCVSDFQNLLVRHGDMDSSEVDGVLGDTTVNRVKGFQIQNGIKDQNGNLGPGWVGPTTWRVARRLKTNQGLPEVCREMVHGACSSKRQGLTYLMSNGAIKNTFRSSFGDESSYATSTNAGVTTVQRKFRHNWSVPFKVWLNDIVYVNNDGEGYHSGDPNVLSHGCVHLAPPDAKKAYAFLRAPSQSNPVGDQVVIY